MIPCPTVSKPCIRIDVLPELAASLQLEAEACYRLGDLYDAAISDATADGKKVCRKRSRMFMAIAGELAQGKRTPYEITAGGKLLREYASVLCGVPSNDSRKADAALWAFEESSGRLKNVFDASEPKVTVSKPPKEISLPTTVIRDPMQAKPKLSVGSNSSDATSQEINIAEIERRVLRERYGKSEASDTNPDTGDSTDSNVSAGDADLIAKIQRENLQYFK